MRYHVRNARGEELVVPTLRDLHHLYTHGFLSDDDLVRSDRATVWVRVGAMPALRGVRELKADPRKMALLLAAAIAVAAGIAILLAR
ncbi:MAG TPA: hypothetical protein VFL83_05275 [Anaeromyxobacter sp.]|nr:hypothetical protein [Anaeromyxobacter sp.]